MLVNPDYLRDSTEMSDDPFSDILQFTNAQTVVTGGFTVGGALAIRFPAAGYIKFFAVFKGRSWLLMDALPAPVCMEAGDVILISHRGPFIIATDPALEPVDAITLFTSRGTQHMHIGDGEDLVHIGGKVKLDAASGGLLTDVLPPLIHVRASSPQAAQLQWILRQLARERGAGLPGAGVAATHLAQLMFVQILRAHLEDAAADFAPGWLRALGDARIAPTLRLMHGDPARAWQLEELAASAAMSRTTFAVRFKSVAGVPPLTYLLNWRMRLAQRALRDGAASMAAIAQTVGYTSESAFSNAFKRVTGMAPKRYRDAARAGAADVSPDQTPAPDAAPAPPPSLRPRRRPRA
jgi:AraC-like DNA-binding protein